MSFLTKDGNLLEKYNEIWEEVKNNLKKRIVSQYIIKNFQNLK